MQTLLRYLLFATVATTALQAVANVDPEYRQVSDSINLDIEQIAEETNHVWVVAEITPDRNNISATIPGAYVKAETGEMVIPPGAQMVILSKGSCRLITSLARTPAKETLSYEWRINYFHSRNPEDKSPSAFRSGGFVLARINEQKEGAEEFGPVYLIPAEWKDFPAPAVEYYRKYADLFQPKSVSEHRAALWRLLEAENPFIAIIACRVLAETGNLDQGFIEGPLARARGVRQGAFTFLYLEHLQTEAKDQAIQKFGEVIAQTTEPDGFDGITVGARLALSRSSMRHLGMRLLQLLEQKRESVKTE